MGVVAHHCDGCTHLTQMRYDVSGVVHILGLKIEAGDFTGVGVQAKDDTQALHHLDRQIGTDCLSTRVVLLGARPAASAYGEIHSVRQPRLRSALL
jgi:hypothetical protein